jgi:hypothetical protein
MPRNRVLVVAGGVLLLAVAVVIALAVGGGDDDPAPAADPDATPTLTAGDFGPPPTLGEWVVSVFPVHASVVPRSLTQTTNPNNPRGVCFEASFIGLPQSALHFRMAVDEQEVTTEGIWIVDSEENPTRGTFCFDPAEGLEPGVHTAAIVVQDPDGVSEPRQIVAWAFEVVP